MCQRLFADSSPINLSFVSNYILPYCLEALQSKTGFVFGAVASLAILFVFFCVPECKGKTLEQVDRMFQEGVPLRKFGSYEPGHLTRVGDKMADPEIAEQEEVSARKTKGL